MHFGSEVGSCDGARSGCAVGWGWGNKEDNGLGLDDGCSHRMGTTAGRLAWVFLGGFIVPACWRGGPKSCDPGVEGHPASAQVNARVLQQGF